MVVLKQIYNNLYHSLTLRVPVTYIESRGRKTLHHYHSSPLTNHPRFMVEVVQLGFLRMLKRHIIKLRLASAHRHNENQLCHICRKKLFVMASKESALLRWHCCIGMSKKRILSSCLVFNLVSRPFHIANLFTYIQSFSILHAYMSDWFNS